MIFSLAISVILFNHPTVANPTPVQGCTHNRLPIAVGQETRDPHGVKECYINTDGRPAFRYVGCLYNNGSTLRNNQEILDKNKQYSIKCFVDPIEGAYVYATACVTPSGNRIDPGSEARDDDGYFYACEWRNSTGYMYMYLRIVACQGPSGERIEVGERQLVEGHWYICKRLPGGSAIYQIDGCQYNGTKVPNGTEWFIPNELTWHRCVESSEGVYDHAFACGNGEGLARLSSGQRFLDKERTYWYRCNIDEYYGITPLGCNNPNGDKLVAPGDSWEEGAFLKTCVEENGQLWIAFSSL